MTVTVMIEIPKGSRNKYEYDKEKKVIRFDRMLFSAVHYPSDYGFIPETLAQDGDPLDALVLVWEPTFPGCIVEAKPVGLFKMWDEKGQDEKILCVPVLDPLWNHLESLSDVPPHLLKEIEHFFSIYKDLEEKKTGVEGWEDRESAIRAIEESQLRYQKIRMTILKHVEHKIKDSDELERLMSHLRETTSKVDGVRLKDIYFPKGKDEFVLVMDCVSEDRYLEWRDICPPPPGAKDWYEVLLTKDEQFHNETIK